MPAGDTLPPINVCPECGAAIRQRSLEVSGFNGNVRVSDDSDQVTCDDEEDHRIVDGLCRQMCNEVAAIAYLGLLDDA
jgi:hypothetical protein